MCCRTLKDQNALLAKTQQSEEEHRKMLDKIASLRRKLSDMEVKNAKLKDEKQGKSNCEDIFSWVQIVDFILQVTS